MSVTISSNGKVLGKDSQQTVNQPQEKQENKVTYESQTGNTKLSYNPDKVNNTGITTKVIKINQPSTIEKEVEYESKPVVEKSNDKTTQLGKAYENRKEIGVNNNSDFSSIDYGSGVTIDLKKTNTANMDTTAEQTILANNAKQQAKGYVDYGSGVTVDTDLSDDAKNNNSALEYNTQAPLTKWGKQGSSIVNTVAGAVGDYAGSLVGNMAAISDIYNENGGYEKNLEERDKAKSNLIKAQQQYELDKKNGASESRLKYDQQVIQGYQIRFNQYDNLIKGKKGTITPDNLYKLSTEISEASNKLTEKAKQENILKGVGKVKIPENVPIIGGQTVGVDIGDVIVEASSSMVQCAIDGMIGNALGIPQLGDFATEALQKKIGNATYRKIAEKLADNINYTVFFNRAFGSAVTKAHNDGADVQGTIEYALMIGAKEVLTEKMSNLGVMQKIYGGAESEIDSALANAIHKVITRITKDDQLGKIVGAVLAGGFGEGFEEFVGTFAEEHMAELAYGGKREHENFQEELTGALYDFVVGATSGLMGNVSTPSQIIERDKANEQANKSRDKVYALTGVDEQDASKGDPKERVTAKIVERVNQALQTIDSGEANTKNGKMKLKGIRSVLEAALESDNVSSNIKKAVAETLNNVYESLGINDKNVDVSKYEIKEETKEPETPKYFDANSYAERVGIPGWRAEAKKYGITYTTHDYDSEENFNNFLLKIRDAQAEAVSKAAGENKPITSINGETINVDEKPVKTVENQPQKSNGPALPEIVFIGEDTGKKYNFHQAKALEGLSIEAIQNCFDSYKYVDEAFPNLLGLSYDSPEWIALKKAGLIEQDTDPDGDVYEYLPILYALDERSRRKKIQKENNRIIVIERKREAGTTVSNNGENTQEDVELTPESNAEVASENEADVKEIDVNSLINAVQEAQGRANETGEKQTVKISEHEAVPETTSNKRYTITDNTEFNTIEIKFDSKPSEAVRNVLKKNKFKWNEEKGIWYGSASRETITKALDNVYKLEEKPKSETKPEAKQDKSKPFFGDEIINGEAVHTLAKQKVNGTAPKEVVDIIDKLPSESGKKADSASLKADVAEPISSEEKAESADKSKTARRNENISDKPIESDGVKEDNVTNNKPVKTVKEESSNEQSADNGLPEVSQPASVQKTEEGREVSGEGSRASGNTPVKSGGDGRQTSQADNGNKGVSERNRPETHGDNNSNSVDNRGTDKGGSRASNKGYVIENAPMLSETPVKRFDANIEAIKLVKQLKAEGRTEITPEERNILARYTGWGGLKSVFSRTNTANERRADELRELIGDSEYNQANTNGTLTAFYTPPSVAGDIYSIVEQLGFTGGKILEPSCGTGIFLGTMPMSMRNNGITAVEIDQISGEIAKLLYPNADVHISGFQDLNASRNSYGLIVGNIPYSKDFKIYDSNFKYGSGNQDIHDFFVLKGLDLLKPGGIMAVLAPTSIMDEGSETTVGSLIKEKADLVTAFRLPAGTFGNTETVCDLIILQKKSKEGLSSGIEFPKSGKITIDGVTKTVSQFYVDNPGNVIGDFAIKEMGKTRKDLIVKDNGKTLADVMDKVPKNVISNTRQASAKAQDENTKNAVLSDEAFGKATGTYIVKDGELYTVDEGRLSEPFKLTKTKINVTDENGEVVIGENGRAEKEQKRTYLKKGSKDYKRAMALTEIANAYVELSYAQQESSDDEALIKLREKLNKLYDEYSNNFRNSKGEPGRLNDLASTSVLWGDPRRSMIASLEKVKEVDGKIVYSKADVFTKRTVNAIRNVTHVDNARDALLASLNINGKIDINYMSQLYQKDKDTIVSELEGIIYENPENANEFFTADEYLSGDVKTKLSVAEANNVNGKYDNQIKALKAVIPADIPIGSISIKLGESWMGPEIVEDFIYDLCGIEPDGSVKVTYIPQTGMWAIKTNRNTLVKWNAKATKSTVDGIDILRSVLSNKPIEITIGSGRESYPDTKGMENVQAKADEMKEYFSNWAKKDAERAFKIATLYNDRMNRNVVRKYDTYQGNDVSFMKMPGSAINLRKHQANAVYRMVSTPATLLNHGVGAGKTFAMIGAAHEMKRLGMANKPLMVVPNHKLNDFMSDWYRMYPTANILVVSGDNWTESVRKRLLDSIVSNDYDCIIMKHSSFANFPFTDEYKKNFFESRLSEAEEALETATHSGMKERALTGLKKRVENYKAKLQELMDHGEKDVIAFDNSGIDAIFVDEAHNFKNLENFTTMSNIAGVDTGNAQKTTTMLMATNYIHSINGKVVFATATPISNTMGEMYNMFRYLRPDILGDYYMESFDAFAGNFGEVVTKMEPNTTGTGIVTKQRFAKFINIPELITGFSTFTDTVSIDDIKASDPSFRLPQANRVHVTVDSTEALDLFNEFIESEKQRIKGMSPDARAREGLNHLTLYNDAKAASLDLRLVLKILKKEGVIPWDTPASALDFKGSKINTVVDKVFGEWKNSSDIKGAQLIFLDKGTPEKAYSKKELERIQELREKRDAGEITEKEETELQEFEDKKRYGFDLYNDIKKKLIELGIPENEIAFIQDTQGANSDKKKEKLFENVRDGNVRVLIGSTAMMGEGMNAQDRIVAIHHVDAPYRPSDIEQRDGRAIRQGNLNDIVNIYMYSTKNSYDAAMWNSLNSKNEFIQSVVHGDASEREFEDIGNDAFEDMSVEAANNPDMFRLADVRAEIKRLETAKRNVEDEAYTYNSIIRDFDKSKAEIEQRIAIAEAALKTFTENPDRTVVINGTTYKTMKEASEALIPIAEEMKSKKETERVVGTFHGFNIVMRRGGGSFGVGIEGPDLIGWRQAEIGEGVEYPFSSVFLRLENSMKGTGSYYGFEDIVRSAKETLANKQKKYEEAKNNVADAVFKDEEKLAQYKAEQTELLKRLGAAGSSVASNPFTSGIDLMKVIFDEHARIAKGEPKSERAAKTETGIDAINQDMGTDSRMRYSKSGGAGTTPVELHPGDWTAARTKDNTAEVKPISDIITDLKQKFGIQVTTGHVQGKDVRGFYDEKSGEVRIKNYNDLPTLIHESLGHELDSRFGIVKNMDKAAVKEMVDNLDEDFASGYSDKELPAEGWAEYMRVFMQNRDDAQLKYPKTYAEMVKLIPAKEFAELCQFADECNAYYSNDSSDYKETLRSHVEGVPDNRTPKQKREDFLNNFYQKNFDRVYGIRRMDEVLGTNTAFKAYNAAYATARAEYILRDEVRDIYGNYVGPGLDAILNHYTQDMNTKEFQEFYSDLNEYLFVKHQPERLAKGKRGVANDAKEDVGKYWVRAQELADKHENMVECAQAVREFWDNVLMCYGVQTGLISYDTYNLWHETYEWYVPLNRVFEVGENGTQGRTAASKVANQTSGLYGAKGSTRNTWFPVENIMQYTINLVKAGIFNNTGLTIADQVLEAGDNADFMVKDYRQVNRQVTYLTGIKAKLADKINEMVDNGEISDAHDAELFLLEVAKINDYIEQFSNKRPSGREVYFMRDGKPEYWIVNDDLLLESLLSLSPKQAQGYIAMLSNVTRFITANITGRNVVWSLSKNSVMDFYTALFYSPVHNPLTLLKGIVKSWRNTFCYTQNLRSRNKTFEVDDLYKEMLAMGGLEGNMYSVDTDTTEEFLKRVRREKSRNPFAYLAFIGNMVEMGPRYAVYEYCRTALDMTPEEAFRAMKESTVDFARGGIVSKDLNKIIPFYNSSVVGVDRFARFLTAKDVSKENRKKVSKSRVITWIGISTVLGVLQYVLNHMSDDDSDEYEKLSNYTKNAYFPIPLGDGKYLSIPKDRELSVPASIVDAILTKYIAGDKHRTDGLYEYIADNNLPNGWNNLAQLDLHGTLGAFGPYGLLHQVVSNKNFLGNPIVSTVLSSKPAKMQYDESTSLLAKQLGAIFNKSPKMIDHVMQNILGGFWSSQKALLPVDSKNRDWTFGVKSTWTKDNQYSTDIVNRLYDMADKSSETAQLEPTIQNDLRSKLDSCMTSFYGKYNTLAKDNNNEENKRIAKEYMLDLVNKYISHTETGLMTTDERYISNLAVSLGSTEGLTPTVMDTTIADKAGNEIKLTDNKYIDMQTTYLDQRAKMIVAVLPKLDANADKKVAVQYINKLAREVARNRALIATGHGNSGYFEKYGDVKVSDIALYQTYLATTKENDSPTHSEMAKAALKLGLNSEQSNLLYKSTAGQDDTSSPWGEKYKGIEPQNTVDYWDAIKIYDKNGGSPSQKEAEAAIRSLGITDNHQNYLLFRSISASWVKNERKNNPWYRWR